LIIEDADNMLVNRKRGDLVALSDLLNIGDGLIGSMLNLRVIATTNSKIADLDEAIKRPGRLCTHMHFDALPSEQADLIYKRLTGNVLEGDKARTLAEIYRLAREDGWTEEKEKNSSGGNYI
jgi:ATP-dependent 26S proteasome regulatory subunit